jgi:hypothetical protein
VIDLRKPAWRPRVVVGEEANTINKFGGTPWLPARVRPPKCTRCDARTYLALQLDVRSLPLALDADGTLQVFLCGAPDASGCFIENAGYVVRFETRPLKPRPVDPTSERMHEPLSIVGWDEFLDEPGFADWPPGTEWHAGMAQYPAGPAGGDKLGGYGKYAQSGELRRGNPFVFQLESSWDGLLKDVYFGDGGKLFICVILEHDIPLAFGFIEYG